MMMVSSLWLTSYALPRPRLLCFLRSLARSLVDVLPVVVIKKSANNLFDRFWRRPLRGCAATSGWPGCCALRLAGWVRPSSLLRRGVFENGGTTAPADVFRWRLVFGDK